MTWTKLGDDFADRPETVMLSDAAFRAHIEGLVYCNKHLTDGRIPADPRLLSRVLTHPESVEELAQAGLWELEGTHYALDWADQEQAAEVEARREEWRRRDERRRRHNKGDHAMCDPKRCLVLLTRETPRESRPPAPVPLPSRPAPVPTPREGEGERESVGTSQAHGSAAPDRPRGDEKRLCVECTTRNAVAQMTQDPETGMWTCKTHIEAAS